MVVLSCVALTLDTIQQMQQTDQVLPISSNKQQPGPKERSGEAASWNRQQKTCFQATNEKNTYLTLAHIALKPPEKSKDFLLLSSSLVSSKLAST